MVTPRRKLIALYAALLAIAVGSWSAALTGMGSQQLWHKALFTQSAPMPAPAEEVITKTISLGAVGDIVMGDAKTNVPANGGKNFFDKVKPLFTADLMMGNLETPVTGDTGYVKCGPDAQTCHQFRAPPAYARLLKEAGFDLMNVANNHYLDYGQPGAANTVKSLEAADLMHTGAKGEITIAEVQGVKVAVLGFSSYAQHNSLIDLGAARDIVRKASSQADMVVIQVHWGAEGADKSHVKPGTEYYLGENRGDPIAFAHAVIDAGADLIIGHGPHTLRAMEVYKGRLIAYSLGNFAGGGGLNGEGSVGWGGVLNATIKADGTFVKGQFTSTNFLSQPGVPLIDSQHRGLKLLRELTQADFPTSGAPISVSGEISTL